MSGILVQQEGPPPPLGRNGRPRQIALPAQGRGPRRLGCRARPRPQPGLLRHRVPTATPRNRCRVEAFERAPTASAAWGQAQNHWSCHRHKPSRRRRLFSKSPRHASEPLRRGGSQRGSRAVVRRRSLRSATVTGGADRQRSPQTPILAFAAGTVGRLETGVRAGAAGGWWFPQHASDVGVKK